MRENISDDCLDELNLSKKRKYRLESGAIRESPARDLTPLRSKTPAASILSEEPEVKAMSSWIIVAIVCAIIATLYFFLVENNSEDLIHSEKINCSKFMDLQLKFPNQDKKLFKSLRSGIEGTINGEPNVPSVFSLFSTDDQLMERMMKEVIKVTMLCINQTNDPISLNNEHLSSKLVSDYKDELMKRNIMIINNVNEAAPADVTTLHSFCDTFNPVWPKSIIFLTMKVPQAPVGKPVEYITNYLNNRWKSIAGNIRGPLITRIIDQTFFIKP